MYDVIWFYGLPNWTEHLNCSLKSCWQRSSMTFIAVFSLRYILCGKSFACILRSNISQEMFYCSSKPYFGVQLHVLANKETLRKHSNFQILPQHCSSLLVQGFWRRWKNVSASRCNCKGLEYAAWDGKRGDTQETVEFKSVSWMLCIRFHMP